MASTRGLSLLLIVLVAITMFAIATAASYRKPPFNGSIFGKRNNNEYESNIKTITAMCEIALDACQSWLPQDKK